MALSKDFLWGGALAAHQFEGGVIGTTKGLSVADVSDPQTFQEPSDQKRRGFPPDTRSDSRGSYTGRTCPS